VYAVSNSVTPIAANQILRLANDGRILLSFKPPGFFTTTKYELLKMREIEAQEKEEDEEDSDVSDESDESDQDNSPLKTTNIFDALGDA
jgi:protein required for attachment to host cells